MLKKSTLAVATAAALLITTTTVTAEDVYAEQPETRFTKWSTLSSDNVDAATSIRYDEESWGFLTTNPIETLSFSENTDLVDGYTEAMETMGIEEDPWDCWVSHFESYGWDELVAVDMEYETSLVSSLEALGWSEEAWNGSIDPPASEELAFSELGEEGQAGATYLCYTETLWDGEESINDFGIEGPGSGFLSGFLSELPDVPDYVVWAAPAAFGVCVLALLIFKCSGCGTPRSKY